MATSKITGKYLYNLAFKAVDYCNDVASGSGTYNDHFSPNNIRRLIISPDVVRTEFYISVPGVGQSKTIRLPSAMLSTIESLPDYVPIVQIISSDRICSSIEEIIFLVRSNDGQTELGYNEYDMSSLISNFGRRSGDLLETVKQRFVRLRDVVVIQGNYNQFTKLERTRDSLVGDLESVKGYAQVSKVHDEPDWYTKWGNPAAAKTYPMMDGIGGFLNDYFAKDISRRKEQEKQKAVDDYKKERYASIAKEFEDLYEKFYRISKLCAMHQKIVRECGVTVGVEFESYAGSLEFLFAVNGLKDYPKVKKAPDGMSLKDAYSSNIEAVKRMIRGYVSDASVKFLNAMSAFYAESPLTVRVFFNYRPDVRVMVTDTVKADADMLQRECHCAIACKNAVLSYETCCYLACLFLVNKSSEKFNARYKSESFWIKRSS